MASVKNFMKRVASGNSLLGSNNSLSSMKRTLRGKERGEDEPVAKPKTNAQFSTRRITRPVRRTRSYQQKMQKFIKNETLDVDVDIEGELQKLPGPAMNLWDSTEGNSEKTLPCEVEEAMLAQQDQEPEEEPEPEEKAVKWHTSVDVQLEEKRVRLLTKPSKIPRRRMTRQELVLVFPVSEEEQLVQDTKEECHLTVEHTTSRRLTPPVSAQRQPIDLDEVSLSSDSSDDDSSSDEDSDDDSSVSSNDEDVYFDS